MLIQHVRQKRNDTQRDKRRTKSHSQGRAPNSLRLLGRSIQTETVGDGRAALFSRFLDSHDSIIALLREENQVLTYPVDAQAGAGRMRLRRRRQVA